MTLLWGIAEGEPPVCRMETPPKSLVQPHVPCRHASIGTDSRVLLSNVYPLLPGKRLVVHFTYNFEGF